MIHTPQILTDWQHTTYHSIENTSQRQVEFGHETLSDRITILTAGNGTVRLQFRDSQSMRPSPSGRRSGYYASNFMDNGMGIVKS